MPYGTDPPVTASGGSGYGKDPAQQPPDTRGPIQAGVEDFLHGLSSGVAGDIVGTGQIVGSVLPGAITDPIANSRLGQALSREANQSATGIISGLGQDVGAALPFLVQPELGIGRAIEAAPYIGRMAPRVLRGIWDVFRNATVPAAVQPAQNQGERAKNMMWGTAVGAPLHIAGEAAGSQLQKWARQRQANLAYDAQRQAAQQARDAAQARAERIGRLNPRIRASNERYQTRYQQQREARDQATLAHQQATQTARQAQEAVPGQTTQNWWREALTPIGEQGRAPATVGPQASAQVRQIVGDRLNQIRGNMRIGRDDMGFRTEIDGIRDQIDQRLTSDAMRNQWHYEPEQRFARDGSPLPPSASELARQRNSLWSRYVEQPLENLPELSGRQMANYVSSLGDLAEQFARDARRAPRAERAELEAISQGLRDLVDVVDRRGSQGDPALREQLRAAKRSYNLWSIGNETVDVAGNATPRNLSRTWMRRQGGAANYGAEMDPSHPRYHAENARLKQGLETARQAHEAPLPTTTPQLPLRAPATRSTIPTPRIPIVPPERTVSQGLPHAASRAIGHGVTALTGSPLAGRIAHGIAHYGGRGVARPVLGVTRAAGQAAPLAAVGTAQSREKMPEIVVTAPRYSPGKDQDQEQEQK